MTSAQAILRGAIDYAGLFPPASLGMEEAVSCYADYIRGPDRALLGRMIVPASRLDELAGTLARIRPESRWTVSAILGEDSAGERSSIDRFNASGLARCDAVELLVSGPDSIGHARRTFEGMDLFFEIPLAEEPDRFVREIADAAAFAKMRTGGTTESSIPSAASVLRFMRACADYAVPFKATAGLHHAVRSPYPLTYERDAPTAEMFGYLNILFAAVFLHLGRDDSTLLDILRERDSHSFRFSDTGIAWRGHAADLSDIEVMRARLLRSWGSCSFSEPVTEAQTLGIL